MTASCCSAPASSTIPVCTAPPARATCTSRTLPAMRSERLSRSAGRTSGCSGVWTLASSTTPSRHGGGWPRKSSLSAARFRGGVSGTPAVRHPEVLAQTRALAGGPARRVLARHPRNHPNALAADAARHVPPPETGAVEHLSPTTCLLRGRSLREPLLGRNPLVPLGLRPALVG